MKAHSMSYLIELFSNTSIRNGLAQRKQFEFLSQIAKESKIVIQ
jgi:hypothetical protein